MPSISKKILLTGVSAFVITLTGCATTDSNQSLSQAQTVELDRRAKELDQREAELKARESQVANGQAPMATAAAGNDLLPPNAAAGECYARVWVDAEYTTRTEEVLVAEESKKITVIPAEYQTVTETVEVKSASSRIETIPAVYGTETETIKIKEGQRVWRVGLKNSDAPASDALLTAATTHGINLEAAQVGMCFHEHYLPASYKTVTEQVMVKAATEEVTIVPAQYEWVEETVMVKEASTKLVNVPAEFETVEEQIIDKPAHTIWKKGRGPIQKIDEATGEIMCLVEVPATYKTVKRTVLKTPARTETVEIPAEYETVKVKKLVAAASEQRNPIPAEYGTVERTEIETPAGFVWHEVHNMDHPASTRTGNKICLTETEPKYKTVERTVVKTPAQTNTIEIPAEYKQVEVTKLVTPAREEVSVIPAEFKTVEHKELVKDGYMAWRSILCETNMTKSRIADIQRALRDKGYEISGIDGVIGSETIRAVNAFQRDNNLPVDRYLNIETVKALGVSTQ